MRILWCGNIWLGLLCCLPSFGQPPKIPTYESANRCAGCHPKQVSEWRGSMMHYSAQSPVFQVFELTTRKLTGRFGRHDSKNVTFCLNCHAPSAASMNEFSTLPKEAFAIDKMSHVGKEGISCTTCHSIREHIEDIDPDKGMKGDGIGNASFLIYPLKDYVGPTTESPFPLENSFHGFDQDKNLSIRLKSAEFCASCHNVNIPHSPDTVTGKGFQVIENAFTEWQEGPYNSDKNPWGRKITCTECHMTPYGSPDPVTGAPRPPGFFPETEISSLSKSKRKHALHAFTSVSISLLDSPDFPNQDTPEKDSFGYPKGQQQRRQIMLEQACSLKLESVPPKLASDVLPFSAVLTNKGAGHRVPTGFSQEREMWLEIIVTDEKGNSVFESGVLVDKAHPETGENTKDGKLHDEDLNDRDLELSPTDLEHARNRMGADFNLRPFVKLGLPRFNNAFLRKKTQRSYEQVSFFTQANHMDNSRSLPMLQPVKVDYEIPLGDFLTKYPDYCGTLNLKSTLRYRTLPPKLLRALSQREPSMLSEQNIDRNTIVNMAQATAVTRLCGVAASQGKASLNLAGQFFEFPSGGKRWLAFHGPATPEDAYQACRAKSCHLASNAEYESLGLAEYKPSPGDNQDLLWTERWSADGFSAEGLLKDSSNPTVYFFTGGAKSAGTLALSGKELTKLPFFCACEKGAPMGGTPVDVKQ